MLLRRTQPTGSDIVVLAVIFKIRRQQNNSDINAYCRLLKALVGSEIPTSWKSIKRKMKLDVSSKEICYKICNACGMKAIDHKCSGCFQCKSSVMIIILFSNNFSICYSCQIYVFK